jgi:hypothetical protein
MRQSMIFALIMALVTTGVISSSLVLFNFGFKPGFIITWLRSWLISYPMAVALIIFVGPGVQALARFINDLLRK